MSHAGWQAFFCLRLLNGDDGEALLFYAKLKLCVGDVGRVSFVGHVGAVGLVCVVGS